MVLDNYPGSGSYNADPEFTNYYSALNKYIAQNKPFARIVQHEDEDSSVINVDEIKTPIVRKHFDLLLERNKDFTSHARLMGSKIFMPKVSFIIIDDKYLVWEMPFIDPKNIFHFSHDLFIADSTGKVVDEFVNMFETIQKESVKIDEFTSSLNHAGGEVHS